VIAWGSFLTVLIASVVGACGVVTLFSIGLRFAGPATTNTGFRRALGITCFVLCGLLIAFGVYLIVPAFHP
jgi:hypothetical protein